MPLTRSNDRKVTNLPNKAGTQSLIANTFGLPAGRDYSCPDATSFCAKICYAGKLEKMYPSARNLLTRNFSELLYADYLNGISGMVDLLDDMLIDFERECDKRNVDKLFRIHWDGDFFSADYARAWAIVIKAHKSIRFWVYTRSFDTLNVIDILAGIDNLTLYLSADPVNVSLANDVAARYPVFIATVADTFSLAKDTIINSSRKSYQCPENKKVLPMIDKKGSACVRCGVCVDGRGDVLFSVGKK